jgi:predicted CoA-binding protein
MASNYEAFFDLDSFAVVGRSQVKPFPILTYRALKKLGKTVFPVNPDGGEIDGDGTYTDLASLPQPVAGVIIETPKDETRAWVKQAAAAGVRDVWVHMAHDTPEAVAAARENGINLRTGTCAVMYLKPGLSYHSIHKAIMQALGKY